MKYTLMSGFNASTGAFTAATTGICTDSAHGLVNDDPVVLTTSDTLPAGLSLATVYYAQVINANTFYLSTATGGGTGKAKPVNITDTGTGTHTWTDAHVSKVIYSLKNA